MTVVASVAVLSDIHGVLPALDAEPSVQAAEPSVQAAEPIVLTGDTAAGPQPIRVLERLLGLGDRVTWVRGNADRELVELVELVRGETDDVGDPIASWAERQLSADHVDWLARLPYPVTLDLEGFAPATAAPTPGGRREGQETFEAAVDRQPLPGAWPRSVHAPAANCPRPVRTRQGRL